MVVGIGETVVAEDPGDTIEMIGLGSCAGIFIVLPGKFAVAAHSLLATPRQNDSSSTPGKYVETAVPFLLEKLTKAGIAKARCKVWVVGGAQMFNFGGASESAAIGSKNTELAVELLRKNGFSPDSRFVGGAKARSAKLSVGTGAFEATGD
jgi:chemotaxis protein CheD